MKKKEYDLTSGRILNKLLLIAGPVMATQLFQMVYNLTDMFFVARISSDAVAATGAAGMFIWLSVAFFVIGSMGAEIGVSQNKGKGDVVTAKRFAQNALFIALVLGLFFAGIMVLFTDFFIGLIGIQEAHVARDAALYLRIVGAAFPMLFVNNAITGAFNGSGNSKLPFYLKMMGLAVNLIVTPFLIFVLDFGIKGAAIGTAIGYTVTGALLVVAIKHPKTSPFPDFSFKAVCCPDKKTVRQILKWSLPVAIENGSFTMLTMLIVNMIANFGADALATKQIGVQIESLTWLVGGGYAAALTSFVGQNYGANQMDRIQKGFKISFFVQSLWGILVTLIMFFGGGLIFRLFTDDLTIIESGIRYLRIAAFVQIISCIDAICAGTFRGLGQTIQPSVTTITFNILRVFIAFALSQTALGLYGVFIGAASGIFFRGLAIFIWYGLYTRKHFKKIETTV
ncbi:MAG: MATE family efflux transporter [Defluviitaleaceae bacterium]|nr:MATE family efflux transporter [Defluviitaleaceae bacterium]